MSSYSVAEAKNGLPGLINRALDGEEVLITRHGRVVAELRGATRSEPPVNKRNGLDWLRARREARPRIEIDSSEMLRALADERAW